MSETKATSLTATGSMAPVAGDAVPEVGDRGTKANESGDTRKTAEADTQLKLRVDYWFKRLDHTLTHTQTSSRLIYLVDGAVLAMVYFVINAFGSTRQIVFFASLPVLVLAVLNGMHALLISTQHWWYRSIDKELAALLGMRRLEPSDTTKHWWRSTHGIYKWMHWLIGGLLFVMACLMLAYGIGWFSDLALPSRSSAGTGG